MDLTRARNYVEKRLSGELPAGLSYHSPSHIYDVYEATDRIAAAEGISGHELGLLHTAALYHDIGFIRQATDHERIGCEIARESLPGFGYSEGDIESICGMIMATRIPQQPKTKLEEIIADADLDYLGRDDFWEIGRQLFEELRYYGRINTVDEWNALQIRFLEQHHYFTATSIASRKQKKEEFLNMLKAGLAPNPTDPAK